MKGSFKCGSAEQTTLVTECLDIGVDYSNRSFRAFDVFVDALELARSGF